MARLCVFIVCLLSLFATVCQCQKRGLPETNNYSIYFRIVMALCSNEDGTITKACIDSVMSDSYVNNLVSRMSPFSRFQKSEGNSDPLRSPLVPMEEPLPDTESVAVKRGRNKNMGFYSNW